ncbi:MAG: gliding motility-associated C-terminal domain-containing protein [Bacteroidota bacterium]
METKKLLFVKCLRKYNKIISLGIALMTMFFLPSLWEGSGMCLFGQNNALILNGGYAVLNGGTNSTPVYLVIDQSSTQGIVRTSGHIISEGQYNYVKWDAGTTTGNYVFPLGVGTADYIPFIFNKTTAASSSINLSSWVTNSQNMPHPGISNVVAVSSMTCTADSVSSAVDRFWDIQSTATADLTFSYRGSENTTTVPGDTLKAQHWNGTSWDAQAGPGNLGVTAGIGTVGPIPGQTTFSPWVLTSALRVIASATPSTICLGSSIQLDASTIGGSGTYIYTWESVPAGFSSSIANPVVSPTVNTTYYVTVSNCATNVTDNISVTVNALPVATIISSDNPSGCGASDGSATAGGGTSYSWNTIPAQNTATAVGLEAGTYTVTVSDGSCSSSTSVTLTDPSAPTVTLSSNDTTICAGSSVIFTAGGATDYEFFVNGASQGAPSPVNVFSTSLLIDGDIVTVDGTNSGCTGSSSGITFVVSALPIVDAGVDQTVCEGTSVTLSGSGASSYTWDNGVFDGIPFTPAVGSITYTVTGTTGGCSNTDLVVVTVNASPLVSFTGLDSVYCGAGDPILLTGNHAPDGTFTGVDVTDYGNGTAGYTHATTGTYTVTYTYTDINGCTISDIQTVAVNPLPSVSFVGLNSPYCAGNPQFNIVGNQAPSGTFSPAFIDNGDGTATINPSVPGIYNITYSYTDGNGCSASDVQQLTINELPSVNSISITDVTVCSNPYDGEITIVANNPTGMEYSIDGGAYSSNNTFTGLNVGAYTISILDTNACSIDTVVTVNNNTGFYIDSVIVSDILCFGDTNAQLTIYAQNAVTYSIDSGTTYVSDSIFYNLGAGSYMIMAQDAGSCNDVSIINISEPSVIELNSSSTDESCGASNGSAQVIVSGGTIPYSYLWSNDSTDYIINNLPEGNYSVTITDINGCSADTNINIINNGGIIASTFINIIPADCYGNLTGSATVQPTGSVPFTYIWSNGDTTETVSGISAGIYYVTVYDAYNCTVIDSVMITQPDSLEVIVTVNDAVCGGSDGSAYVVVNGGTPNFSYQWEDNIGTVISITDSISNIGFGDYTIEVTDANGCQSIQSIHIDNSGGGNIVVNSAINVSCYGQTDGEIVVSIAGGTPDYTYEWSTGDSIVTSATSDTLSGLSGGIYFITITDINGCSTDTSITITEPGAISISFISIETSCNNTSDGQINLTVTGGVPPFTYLWAPSGFTQTGSMYSGLPAGSYALTVTDNSGCYATIPEITVTKPTVLDILVNGISPSCYGENSGSVSVIANGGTPPYSYIWNSTVMTTPVFDSVASGLISGTYFITVTDSRLCDTVDYVTLTDPTAINLTIVDTVISYLGQITTTVTGGNPPYLYLWSNGATTSHIEGLNTGDYIITITDASNCYLSDTVEIKIPLIIPTMITPNGDGFNDAWEITNIGEYENIHVEIYNRWGDIVFIFSGSGIEYMNSPWDGTHNGADLPMSSFVYIIDLLNGSEPYNGVVAIKR